MSLNLPPHCIESEESLIAAILLGTAGPVDEIDLYPEDFYRTKYQQIFQTALELSKTKIKPDLLSINQTLKDKKILDEIGGSSELARLVETVPIAINIPYAVKIIKDKSILRQVISTSNDIMRFAYNNPVDIPEFLSKSQKQFLDIENPEKRSETFQVESILGKAIDDLELKTKLKTGITGVATGYKMVDTLTSGFQPADLIILAARPAMGKTSLMINMADSIAANGFPVGCFSIEMTKEQLVTRQLAFNAKISGTRVRSGYLYSGEWEKIIESAGKIEDYPLFINDNPIITIEDIHSIARRWKKEIGIKIILIDYLQLVYSRLKFEKRHLEVAHITRTLRAIAKELKIPIIALAQLNRMAEHRGDKRPILADLRESGSVEQDADIVMFIHRDTDTEAEIVPAELIFAKHRNGQTRSIPMMFDRKLTLFYEKEEQRRDYHDRD